MEKELLSERQIAITMQRLCYELIERHKNFENTVFLALQPRGTLFGKALLHTLQLLKNKVQDYGELDCTFYRDDFRRNGKLLLPNTQNMDVEIEGKNIVLIDDVLYTGRTIRAAMDAINDFGRPASVELLVLVDRKFNRELPIHPDYFGQQVDTRTNDYVRVEWEENKGKVWLLTQTSTK